MNICPVVALGSGQGSTIDFFCKKVVSDNPPFQIKAIITENPHSGLVNVADKFNLPFHIVEYKNRNFQLWDKKLCQALLLHKPQLILLAGFLKKIGPLVLNRFPNRIINSHPSFLPEFSGPGMYGSKVHQAVIDSKKSYTGVSIHVVNQNYDEGAVLAQKKILIQKGETALTLEKKMKKIEKDFYFETVLKVLKGDISLS